MLATGLPDGLLDVVVAHRHIREQKGISEYAELRCEAEAVQTPACLVLAIELLQAKGESEGPPSWEMQLEIGRE